MATQLQEAVRPCLGGLHVLVQMLAPSFGAAHVEKLAWHVVCVHACACCGTVCACALWMEVHCVRRTDLYACDLESGAMFLAAARVMVHVVLGAPRGASHE